MPLNQTKWIVVAAFASVVSVASAVHAQGRPPVSIRHIFAGPDGESHVETIQVPLSKSTTVPTAGMLDASSFISATQFEVLRTSPDYLDTFHSVASRRYVVMISGHREMQVSDGTKFVVGPGDITLVEDTTGKGHLTRGVRGEDAVNILIVLSDKK
jgi:hypothetical protein